MTTRSFSDLIANEDTNLTATAVGDYLLIYDASEPLDINKIKVVSIADLMKLTTETARQPMVTGQAAGDLFYASAAGVLSRLAKGTASQVLKMNAGATAPEWDFKSGLGCSVYRGTSQSIPSSTTTWTNILFDSENYDDADFHSTSTNTDRITIPIGYGGRYLVGSSCLFNTGSYGVRAMRLTVNTAALVGATNTVDGGSDATYLNVSTVCTLADNDYIKAEVRQNVGINIDILTTVPALLWCIKI